MAIFKILGGVALGVGAVAAAPFTGGGSILGAVTLAGSLAGGATMAGAVAAGVAGGVTAAMLDDNEKEKQEAKVSNARKEGVETGKLLTMQEYEKKVEILRNRLAKYDDYARNIVGLLAVGLAMANSDGTISAEEENDLEMFITGISKGSLPKHVQNEINRLHSNIPSFDEAISLAQTYGCRKQDISDVMELIANSDGKIHPAEETFMKKWNSQSSTYAIQ